MHAIGDRAVEAALDAVEQVLGPEAARFRPRIEHCCLVPPDLLQRLRRVKPVVVTQPRFLYELAEGYRSALGEERLRWLLPVARLQGLPVALSSDRPVVEGAPLKGIAAAVTRRTREGWLLAPEEALSAEEAVRAYTVGGAYAAFAEADLGTLSVGKWADFVVLDRDPLGAEAEELEEARVLYTAVGGEVVYEAA
jgi:predicted amidohydrolase YtcJ